MVWARRSASLLLAVLVLGLFTCTQVGAQEGQSYEFSETSSGALGGRLRLSLAPGWGLYRMDDVNKQYIDRFAKEAGIFEDNIDGGPNGYGEIAYFVTPSVSASFGINYLRGQIEQKSWESIVVPGEGTFPMRWERSLTTSAIVPQIGAKYHIALKEDLDLFAGGGVAFCWGKISIESKSRIPAIGTSEETNEKFSAYGTGVLGSVGLSHDLSDTYSIGTEIGYRHFVTADLESEGGSPWLVEYGGTSHKINLDFSGLFMLVSLSIRL